MTLYNPNLDLINVNVCTKFGLILFILCQDIEQNEILTSIKGRNSITNLFKFCPLILKILRGNEILTSINGYNYITNVQKIVLYNPNLDVINVNVYTNIG